tara:strand:- start:82 stop:333 length:252 start_codon:yes stop_codon:yes gene_type:complete
MPSKGKGEDGVKSKQRSKSDKARRTFELNGTYSTKHMRIKAERDEKSRANQAAAPPAPQRTRSWGENSLKAALPAIQKKGKKK